MGKGGSGLDFYYFIKNNSKKKKGMGEMERLRKYNYAEYKRRTLELIENDPIIKAYRESMKKGD